MSRSCSPRSTATRRRSSGVEVSRAGRPRFAGQQLCGASPAEGLPGTMVDLCGDTFELVGADAAQVDSLWKVVAQQTSLTGLSIEIVTGLRAITSAIVSCLMCSLPSSHHVDDGYPVSGHPHRIARVPRPRPPAVRPTCRWATSACCGRWVGGAADGYSTGRTWFPIHISTRLARSRCYRRGTVGR
jgi:hypothetical protein